MTEVIFNRPELNEPASVFAEQVFAVCYMPSTKVTAIIGPGGALLYVTETREEVVAKIKQAVSKQVVTVQNITEEK